MSNTVDAVVIGSGLGGLTCGAFLARAGRKVLVLERHAVVGGYAHAFRRRSYVFDSGIHSVPMGDQGLIMHLLRLLGCDDRLRTIELPSIYQYRIPGRTLTLPMEGAELRECLYREFPHQRDSVNNLFAGLDRFYDVLARPLFDFEKVLKEEDREFLSQFHNQTYHHYIESFVDDPSLRQVFYSMWPYGGNAPDCAPVAFYSMMFAIHFREGSHQIEGGFSQLAGVLSNYILSRGGGVRTRAGVRNIIMEERDRIDGVVLDSGEEIRAPLFVSNISPYTLHTSMIPDRFQSKLWKQRLNSLRPSVSCVAVYLGLESSASHVAEHPIIFSYATDNHRRIQCSIAEGNLDARNHLVVLTQPRMEPGPVVMLMYFAHKSASTNWKEDKRRQAEWMIDEAEKIVPGLKGSIRQMEIGSPETFERYTGNTNGSLYGFENTFEMYGEAKLPIRTYIRNLFQVGHWGKPGGGVWNVMANGYTAAKLVDQEVDS